MTYILNQEVISELELLDKTNDYNTFLLGLLKQYKVTANKIKSINFTFKNLLETLNLTYVEKAEGNYNLPTTIRLIKELLYNYELLDVNKLKITISNLEENDIDKVFCNFEFYYEDILFLRFFNSSIPFTSREYYINVEDKINRKQYQELLNFLVTCVSSIDDLEDYQLDFNLKEFKIVEPILKELSILIKSDTIVLNSVSKLNNFIIYLNQFYIDSIVNNCLELRKQYNSKLIRIDITHFIKNDPDNENFKYLNKMMNKEKINETFNQLNKLNISNESKLLIAEILNKELK